MLSAPAGPSESSAQEAVSHISAFQKFHAFEEVGRAKHIGQVEMQSE